MYGNFLENVKTNGYLTNGEIVDLLQHRLSEADSNRLNGYSIGEMQNRIFLDASSDINDADRKKLLNIIQEITNYKLKLSEKYCNKNGKCGYEVVIETDEKGNPKKIVVERDKNKKVKRDENNEMILRSLGVNEKEYERSNKLISKLLEKDNEVFITNEKDNTRNLKWIDYSSGSVATYNIEKETNKTFYLIRLDYNQENKNYEWNPEMKWGERPPEKEWKSDLKAFIVMAHEMIHIYHYITGTNSKEATAVSYIRAIKNSAKLGVVEDVWLDENGRVVKNFLNDEVVKGKIEEYRTVGIGNETKEKAANSEVGEIGFWNEADDITENMIRGEHGLRYRAAYKE